MNKAMEIRAKALKLFSQLGYDKTTLGQIAKEVGIKPPSLYNHFSNKEQLFIETFEDAVGEHVTHINTIIQEIAASSVEKKLYTIFKEAALYYADKEEKIMFINKSLIFPPPELKERLKDKYFNAEDQFTGLLEPIFVEGMKNGEIKEQSFQAMLTSFYCMLDGLFMHSIHGGRRNIEHKVHDVWNIFWSGIKNQCDNKKKEQNLMKVHLVATEQELHEVFNIRTEVFVKEQGVPFEEELDEHEDSSEHVIAYYDDKPVGTGRLRMIDGIAKLERICILPAIRKLGLGRIIVTALENIAKEKGASTVKLHGQTHAEYFYTKLGYQRKSEMFMEEGIPHVLMEKTL